MNSKHNPKQARMQAEWFVLNTCKASKRAAVDEEWKQWFRKTHGPAMEANPDLQKLRDKLVAHGGDEALVGNGNVTPEEAQRLLTRGQFWGGEAKSQPMEPRRCHENSRCLMEQGVGEVANGLALSADGLWRPHSWVVTPEGLIETTTPRTAYFGVM